MSDMDFVAELSRGLGALRRHKLITALVGLGALGVVDLIGQFQTIASIMNALAAQGWLIALLASPIFRLTCLVGVVIGIWLIGRLAIAEEQRAAAGADQAATERMAGLTAAIAAEREALVANIRGAIADEGKLGRLVNATRYHQLRVDALQALIRGSTYARNKFAEELDRLKEIELGRRAREVTIGMNEARTHFEHAGMGATSYADLRRALSPHYPPRFKKGEMVLSQGMGLTGGTVMNAFRAAGNEEWLGVQMYNLQLMDHAITAAQDLLTSEQSALTESIRAMEAQWAMRSGV